MFFVITILLMRTHLFVLLLAGIWLLPGSGQAQLTKDLVAHYPFDGDGRDISTFNHHARRIVGGQFVQDTIGGQPKTVLAFAGVGDYVQIGHAPQIDFDQSDEFALAFWLKLPATQLDIGGSVNEVLSKWDNASATPYPFVLRLQNQRSDDNGLLQAVVYAGKPSACAGANSYQLKSPVPINDERWHHIILQRGSTNSLELFIDGKLVGTTQYEMRCPTRNRADLIIGTRQPGRPFLRSLTGRLDDLRIYRRALSKREIRRLQRPIDYKLPPLAESFATERDKPDMSLPADILPADPPRAVIDANVQILNQAGERLGPITIEEFLVLPPGIYYLERIDHRGKQQRRQIIIPAQ
jgi:hypothetical protein